MVWGSHERRLYEGWVRWLKVCLPTAIVSDTYNHAMDVHFLYLVGTFYTPPWLWYQYEESRDQADIWFLEPYMDRHTSLLN